MYTERHVWECLLFVLIYVCAEDERLQKEFACADGKYSFLLD